MTRRGYAVGMATKQQLIEAFAAYVDAHRAAGLGEDSDDYHADVKRWNDANPVKAQRIGTLGARIGRSKEQQRELEALVHERQTWVRENRAITRLDADCLRLVEGTPASAFRLIYVHPTRGGQRGAGSRDTLGDTRSEAIASLRGRAAGIWDMLNATESR